MQTTLSDDPLLALFGEHQVCTLQQMLAAFTGSRSSLWRALKRLGYFTSYNHNGTFYTLRQIPRFDRHGLWVFQDIRFCRDGTLAATLLRLLQESAGGLTVADLE